MSTQNYLVDAEAISLFPVIGNQGCRHDQNRFNHHIKEAICPQYITEEPIVLIRFANFKVRIGEASRSFVIDNENILLEALH